MARQDAADGTPFGRYRLLSVLGQGGMGEVWRAHDTVTERVVAIKVLSANLSKDEDFQRRFRREAHAAARLETPHVVPIYDYGEIDERLFVCMRLIKGRDLAAALAEGPLEPARAVRIVAQVAEALHAAHEIGLIHRDIKPSNILLDDRDFAYLIDFGIARVVDDTRITKTGNTIGTFAYIAPERLAGEGEEDARVDIYSLACVLYECLTGEPPFAADTMPRLIVAHMSSPPPRPSITRPEVPAQVDEVIATGMAKDPDHRYATTIELADAARDAITEPIHRPAGNPTRIRETQPAPNRVIAQPATVKAEPPAPVSPAPQPAPPAPAKAGGIGRRTTIALIVGAIALVAAVIAWFVVGLNPSIVVGGLALVLVAALGIAGRTKIALILGAVVNLAVAGAVVAVLAHTTDHMASSYGSQIVLPFTGLNAPSAVAVDGAGAVYVADGLNNRVLKLMADASTPTELPFAGLNVPLGVAVDSTAAVYVTDANNNRVLKLAAGSSTQEVLPFTLIGNPVGVAVDSSGTVYVVDVSNRVLRLVAGSSAPTELSFTGLAAPSGVAVDSSGSVYITDFHNSRVLKLAAGSSTQEVLPFAGLTEPHGVAVDSTGSVYVTDQRYDHVLKLAAAASASTELPFVGLSNPHSVAVDSSGALYVADTKNNRVLKLPAR